MSHEITFGTAFCYTPVFKINGMDADAYDFGSKYDASPGSAEPYGCGDMTFEPKQPSADVLAKYGIDDMEYWTIANTLANGLSFGRCGWCV